VELGPRGGEEEEEEGEEGLGMVEWWCWPHGCW
jgi:hypothetical protein